MVPRRGDSADGGGGAGGGAITGPEGTGGPSAAMVPVNGRSPGSDGGGGAGGGPSGVRDENGVPDENGVADRSTSSADTAMVPLIGGASSGSITVAAPTDEAGPAAAPGARGGASMRGSGHAI